MMLRELTIALSGNVNRSLLNMLAKYFSIIRNYVLSVSLQRKYTFYHQNRLLDAFRTNSRNIIGGNPSMVIPLLANQDLTPMPADHRSHCRREKPQKPHHPKIY